MSRPYAHPEGSLGATLYALRGDLIIEALSWLEDFGVWSPSGQLTIVSESSTDHDVGEAVIGALADSGLYAPGADQKPLLRAAGVRSNRALVRAARTVSLRADGDAVVINSSSRGKEGGGWLYDPPEDAVRLREPGTDEIGRAVRDAVARSR